MGIAGRGSGLTTVLDVAVDVPKESVLSILKSSQVWVQLVSHDDVTEQEISEWEGDFAQRVVKGAQRFAGYEVRLETVHRCFNDDAHRAVYSMNTTIDLFGLSTETVIDVISAQGGSSTQIRVAVKGSSMLINRQVVQQSTALYERLPGVIKTLFIEGVTCQAHG